MASLLEVLGPVLGKHGTRRLLDYCYGPDARDIRREMMAIAYHEPKMTKSDRRCQWGLFRKKLLEIAGVSGNCIANEDRAFHARYEIILDTIAAGLQANTDRAERERELPATEIEIVIPADYDLGKPAG